MQPDTQGVHARFLARLLIASAVAVGIVVMHALVAPPAYGPPPAAVLHMPAVTGHGQATGWMLAAWEPANPADHTPAHGLHAGELCLAVLGGVLVVAMLISGMRDRAGAPLSPATAQARSRLRILVRAPPPTPPTLAELCLLRI